MTLTPKIKMQKYSLCDRNEPNIEKKIKEIKRNDEINLKIIEKKNITDSILF